MASHTQHPSPQQIAPLHDERKKGWAFFTRAATIGVMAVVIILALMAVFLIRH